MPPGSCSPGSIFSRSSPSGRAALSSPYSLEMAFVDEAKIKVMAGGGGNGAVAFQRQPFQPKGGPDGGDGGDGGSVILVADTSVGTLLDIRDHPHITADRGGHGEGKRRHGKRGADRRVRVPVGTVVYDDQ